MAKEKACKKCRSVYDGTKCPVCGASSNDAVDNFKGKVIILNPEQSEIAKKLGIDKKGTFAARLR